MRVASFDVAKEKSWVSRIESSLSAVASSFSFLLALPLPSGARRVDARACGLIGCAGLLVLLNSTLVEPEGTEMHVHR